MSVRLLLPLTLLITHSAFAQAPKDDLAPFLDEQVIAVIRIRPDKIQDATVADLDRKLTPAELRDIEGWKSPLSIVREKVGEWIAAGGGDIYAVVSFHDVPRVPPFVVLFPREREKLGALAALVRRWDLSGPERILGDEQIIGEAIVLGHPNTRARLKAAKPTERTDVQEALSAGPDEAVRLVITPSPETRRVYRELLRPLPAGISSATSAELLDHAQRITVHADFSAAPALRVSIQAKDAAGAEVWKQAITNATAWALKNEALLKQFPGLQKPAVNPAPTVKGDRVEMVWGKDGERLDHLVSDVLQPAFNAAYHQAATAQSMNCLKQLMLGMHIYHDRYKTFPPAAILSKDGKKLLSWRVALLPYLDAEALYKEFKLDEPWDSEHNRKLIPKMPAVFASDLMPAGKSKQGVTAFVVPVGEGTCFAKAEGTAIKDIKDGTSNTIGVVLAIPSAVEWTKPADWEVDFKNVAKGWRREPADPKESLAAGFCDGSVRRIPASTADQTIRRLLQIADGEVVKLP